MTESDVAVIISRLDALTLQVKENAALVKENKDEANEWRNRFMDRINKLPCDVRCEETKGIKMQLRALWALICAILLGIIAEWVKLK